MLPACFQHSLQQHQLKLRSPSISRLCNGIMLAEAPASSQTFCSCGSLQCLLKS